METVNRLNALCNSGRDGGPAGTPVSSIAERMMNAAGQFKGRASRQGMGKCIALVLVPCSTPPPVRPFLGILVLSRDLQIHVCGQEGIVVGQRRSQEERTVNFVPLICERVGIRTIGLFVAEPQFIGRR